MVQGVSEVVPVSSSAQLHLLPWLLGWPAAADRTSFAAGLHAGSAVGIALAVKPSPRELAVALAASLPAAAVGFAAQDLVEERLGRPGPTAALLAGAGLALLVADRSPESHAATGRDVGVAGVAQAAALVPGVSRAGATLIALRLRGVRRQEALRTSLVMSLPVTVGAAALTAARSPRTKAALHVPTLLAAAAAFVTARRVVGSNRLSSGSAAYRLGLAAVVARRVRTINRESR